MKRRSFLKSGILGSTALFAGLHELNAMEALSNLEEVSGMKITKIRYYSAPGYNKPLFNQARGIVEIETDGGIIGIGEGGSKDMIEQCAKMMIGEDPFRIEYIWQNVYRGMFYPPGREKLHALGALEMALWDLKGKALNAPVYDLLGGASRDSVECYATGFRASKAKTNEQRAIDCLEAGLRCYRIGPTGGNGESPFDFYENAEKTIELCKRIDSAVGGKGNWAIDLHTRFDPQETIKICSELEELQPYFVEDLIRSENPGSYRMMRSMTKVPIAVGEQFGDIWDINELVEQELINYSRVTLPNTGGLSHFKKIAAMCETHYVGMIPHFTGPLSTAALVHVLGSSSPSRCMMELLGGEPERPAYFNEDFIDFRKGKLHLNPSPGLGVKFDSKKADFIMEITEKVKFPHPILKAPDGSIRNW
ncbi:mandelate racemase/muconate lactonizing enzyme family protein [uncultured Algibacter sp.]|uniref:mandelate racemase/muconate lactonizing enzyme family protein n=1 Tax=uncultured Algibacter sp. TaxID=298659 RepID=UPI00262696EA|nr:mandelate racemase/muconate lactonizing enzyme family protein [uncultured Algibacter sp.]